MAPNAALNVRDAAVKAVGTEAQSGLRSSSTPAIRQALALNLAPISFSSDVMLVGRLEFESDDAYRTLREQHRKTHVLRFDTREQCIFNIGLKPEIKPLGRTTRAQVVDHLLLLGKAVRQTLLRWLASRRTIIKPDGPLICWGKRDAALLSKALSESGIAPREGLDVVVRHSFDTRVLQSPLDDAAPFLVLTMDVGTSNVVQLPASDLLASSMDIVGRYICRREQVTDEDILPKLDTLGRVTGHRGGMLLLTDSPTAEECVPAASVVLEQRQEHLEDVVRHLYPDHADRVLERVKQLRSPYASGRGKLHTVATTLDGLRKSLPLRFQDGLTATIGALLQEGDALFPARISTSRPSFLFGAQGRETGTVPDAGIKSFGPYRYMHHERNAPVVAMICEPEYRGRVEQFAQMLRGGFDDIAWREATSWRRKPVENPFRGGLVSKFRLQRVQFEYELAASGTPDGYRKAIARLLQRLARTPDLALVQTHKAHELLAPAANPYLAAKAAFMLAGVPVQSVHLETMEMPDANLPYTLNNVALAAYAKLNGVPWVISTRPPSSHELVIGLGYSEVGEERFGPRSRYVGITTVFQGDGRYLVWGQTREVEFENYADALYATLRSTIEYVRQENNWQAGDHIRLVFHVYKPLKHREMDAIKELVAGLVSDQHPVEYAFLDISRHHEYQLFDPAQAGVYYPRPGRERGLKGIYVPVRGEARQLSARSALLQLIGPEQVKTDAQGAPRPLLIELSTQSDFTDLTYLVRQVFHFSFMSWRSFFPAVEPVTILYSRLIANSLGNFELTPGWNSNVLTVGTLRSSMWFL